MITKTDFLAYLDAPRHLWAIKHNKLSKTELNSFLEHLFEQGYEVEKYANLYIEQNLIRYHYNKETKLQPTVIDDNYEARTDALLLNPKTNKWELLTMSTTNIMKSFVQK